MSAEHPACVVTGASGLIGSRVLSRLATEWQVHAITHAAEPPRVPGARWYHCDLGQHGELPALPTRAAAVLYLAQAENFREFPDRAMEIFNVNAAGLIRLLEYARRAGARSFVYASSGGLYQPRGADLTEASEVMARGELGFYLGTKLCAEIIAEQYAAYFTVVILRFFFVYGPGQRSDMLIPRLVRMVREGEPVTLNGASGIQLNPTYVTDAAMATQTALLLSESNKINVGGPETVTLRELCRLIGERVGREPVFRVDETSEPQHLVADISKMSALLGAPRVLLAEGLRRYIGGDPG